VQVPIDCLRRRVLRAIGGLVLLIAAGETTAGAATLDAPPPELATKVRVVVTTGMAADLLRQVGGDRLEVIALMGEGVDPHLHRPGRSDLRRMLRADLVIAHGLGLEARLAPVLRRLEESGRRVWWLGDLVPSESLRRDPAAPEVADPHLWMDPLLWATTARGLGDRLAGLDPAGADEFRGRAETTARGLEALHAEGLAAVATIPMPQRLVVTAHDAFGYFGRSFGLEVMALQGLSTASEAGIADLERLVEVLVERRVPAVFLESTISPRAVEAMLAGVRARGGSASLGGTLHADALGPAGRGADTVLGMIRHDLRVVVEGLGGDAAILEAEAPR